MFSSSRQCFLLHSQNREKNNFIVLQALIMREEKICKTRLKDGEYG